MSNKNMPSYCLLVRMRVCVCVHVCVRAYVASNLAFSILSEVSTCHLAPSSRVRLLTTSAATGLKPSHPRLQKCYKWCFLAIHVSHNVYVWCGLDMHMCHNVYKWCSTLESVFVKMFINGVAWISIFVRMFIHFVALTIDVCQNVYISCNFDIHVCHI